LDKNGGKTEKVKKVSEKSVNYVEKLKKQLNFYTRKGNVKSTCYSNQLIILLVCKKLYFNTNKLDPSIPSVCVSLLQELDDVFPNKIPSELSSIRGIKHHIDLALSVLIPNQPAY
jgi:hypothetical protein